MNTLRFALRQFGNSPGFTLTVTLVLALGIGATTAIFSVVYALLLKPLAYRDSARLVQIQTVHPEQGVSILAPATFYDVAAGCPTIETIAAQQYYYVNLTKIATPSRLTEAQVTADYFRLLGVAPQLGRTWDAAEAREGAAPVVVLGAGLWRSHFNARPDIIGETVVLDDTAHTVIGVMPDGFSDPWGNAQAWRPMPVNASIVSERANRYWSTFARLQPGATLEQADRELALIAGRLAEAYPAENKGWNLAAADLQGLVVGNYRVGLRVVLGAVLCVLLITCANVAGLCVVRAIGRHKELTVRAALGASRRQLVGQLLSESLLLALFGGGLGVLLANWGVTAILRLVGNGWLPRAGEIAINGPVLSVALTVTLLTGLAFGLAPAWNAAQVEAGDALRQNSGRGSAGPGSRRLRSGLVVAELALALMLLVGAGLLAASFREILRQNPGMRTENLLAVGVSLPITHYNGPEKMRDFYRRAHEAVVALPGVDSAAFSQTMPFTWGITASLVPVGPARVDERSAPPVYYDSVGVDFFRTAGIPLLGGRLFADRDDAQAPPVVVISAAAARAYFGQENPVGRRLRPLNPAQPAEFEIIGVVGDVLRTGLGESQPPLQVYRALSQRPPAFATLLVHTRVPPSTLAKAVAGAIWSVDPDQAVESISPVSALIANSTTQPRLYLALFGLFAGLAVLLAGIGLYGLVAYSVAQRTREFGIRAALGASPRAILGQVLRENLILGATGLGLGLVGALAGARLLHQMVFEVSVHDARVFAAVPALLAVVALFAVWLPARHATRTDPAVALRAE